MSLGQQKIVCFFGSKDLQRKIQHSFLVNNDVVPGVEVFSSELSDVKSTILTKRPDIVYMQIGSAQLVDEYNFYWDLLTFIKERFDDSIPIVLVVTDSRKFAVAGSLLISPENHRQGSDLVHDVIVSPPSRSVAEPDVEVQALHSASLLFDYLESGNCPPTLNSPNWAPSFASRASRNSWMRWVPRFASYTSDNPLIVGPTGAGKTRMAAALHSLSGRSGPFISTTPRDFSSSELVQAELFGAVAGAYTGAVEKWGLVKEAEKGTLFMDELQSIDLDLQGKLITFIETKTYRRVGESSSHNADVRFIFATNRPLEELVTTNTLRDDFAYRLERLSLDLPPLNQRPLDISAGLCLALAKVNRVRFPGMQISSMGSEKMVHGFSLSAYKQLYSASWPGNLRQLENAVSRLVDLCSLKQKNIVDEQEVLDIFHNMLKYRPPQAANVFTKGSEKTIREIGNAENSLSLDQFSDQLNINIISEALKETGGDVKRAAELISINESTIELYAYSHEE